MGAGQAITEGATPGTRGEGAMRRLLAMGMLGGLVGWGGTAQAQAGAEVAPLLQAAVAAIDSGQFAPADRRTRLYAAGQRLADSAVRIAPRNATAHATRAIALGRTAQALGAKERTAYATEVRREVRTALALDPNNAPALHVLGMWHAEILRLNPVARLAAKTLLGGAAFAEADWGEAQRALERAVQLEPDRITHRLDLAGVLADRGDAAGAAAQYAWIARAPAREFNDAAYKRLAAERARR